MSAFYNEFDPFAAAWLRELIKAGVIEDGEVCEKDMWDVVPSELAGFERVHFCAGIGGWAEALRLAGWPDDQTVWTVSLPCQPFSSAGKGGGLADARGQLAEAFFWLAGVCRPGIIFGEQVEAAIRHDWLDVMASQLESIGYTVGAVAFPASSVGAFHIRQRLYWVAVANNAGSPSKWPIRGGLREEICAADSISTRSPARLLADATDNGHVATDGNGKEAKPSITTGENGFGEPAGNGNPGILVNAEDRGRRELRDEAQPGNRRHADGAGTLGELGDSGKQGLQRHKSELSQRGNRELFTEPSADDCGLGASGHIADVKRGEYHRPSLAHFWSDAEWIPCRDGKYRPIQRATQSEVECIPDGIQDSLGLVRLESGQQVFSPLIQKTKNRVGRLRGYGNAIVVQAAAEFIKAFMGV